MLGRVPATRPTYSARLDALRGLFSEQGYFSTKIDDIATRGRVCCATIYAVSGGKQGLLNTLMDI